jgi:hypothetical protein
LKCPCPQTTAAAIDRGPIFEAGEIFPRADVFYVSAGFGCFGRGILSSHDLPSSIFWEDRSLKIVRNSLILLVGARGFEHVSVSVDIPAS